MTDLHRPHRAEQGCQRREPCGANWWGGALVLAVVVAPAVATAGSNLCPSNSGCIYTDNNFVGLLGYKAAGATYSNVSSGANDKMDSWENKAYGAGAWWYDQNKQGKCYTMYARSDNPNLGVFPSDELSSWRMNGGCP